MLYFYCLTIIFLSVILFYWWKQSRYSRQFINSVSIQIHYRFQDIDDKYSGNGRARNGALIFTTVRAGEDVRNIVVKSAKLSHANFRVNLSHLMMITFPNDSNIAHDASLRFRMIGKSLTNNIEGNHFACVKGFLTSENFGRIPFRVRVPISILEE